MERGRRVISVVVLYAAAFSVICYCFELAYNHFFQTPRRRLVQYLQKKAIWEKMNEEIEGMVGLGEIKQQLQQISHKIKKAEMFTLLGKRVVPPNPFHMAFIGNSGTGKSTVVEVLGKAFFLAGSLQLHTVVEIDRLSKNLETIDLARGGILVIDVDELIQVAEIEPEAATALISVMDAGDTSVIFAGMHDNVNWLINSIEPLYKRLSITLRFECLTYDDMAKILWSMVTDESLSDDNIMEGFKFDDVGCTVEEIKDMLEREVSKDVTRVMNAYLVQAILVEAIHHLETRMAGVDVESDAKITITLEDLEEGARSCSVKFGGCTNHVRGLW